MIIQVKVKEVAQGEKGSAYSGNYGHAGIPGHQGGSAPTGGGSGSIASPGENLRGTPENIQKASDPSHTFHAIYKRGNAIIASDTVAQVYYGSKRGGDEGTYTIDTNPAYTMEPGKIMVTGNRQNAKKSLIDYVDTVEQALASIDNHYYKASAVKPKEKKRVLSSEESPIALDKVGPGSRVRKNRGR